MAGLYILLGTNLGERVQNLFRARELICETFKNEMNSSMRLSSVYETEPWGFKSEYYFLNQALTFDTDIDPELALQRCLSIERQMGRVRNDKQRGEKRDEGREGSSNSDRVYESRLIDIDILLYGNRVMDTPSLKLPHHRLPEREFALLPMTEIAPDLIHPVSHKSMKQLLREVREVKSQPNIRQRK